MTRLATLLIIAGSLVACTGEGPAQEQSPTYVGAIHELMKTHCLDCHRSGGAAPFELDGYETIKSMASASLAAMESGRMPPWPADPDCQNYQGQRVMEQDEIDLFRRWVEAGSPRGEGEVEADAPPPPLFEANQVIRPVAQYLPDGDLSDDYRCFPMDYSSDRDQYLEASEVIPGADGLVHHVLIYAIAPDLGDELEALDDADPGPGYACFGGSEVGVPKPIGAWVPGMPALVLGTGMATLIPANSRLVMQVHYNLIGAEPAMDLTQWRVLLSEDPPERLVESRPFALRTLKIPAGETDSSHSIEFENKMGEAWTVAAISPHMHLLGRSVRVDRLTPDGAQECMVNLPNWDFNWQMPYRLNEADFITVEPGDKVRLTCVYDNSESNQPVVAGERQASREVVWGDGTMDEMCLAYLTTVRPFTAPPPKCRTFSECWVPCKLDSSRFTCMTRCMGDDMGCGLCMVDGIFRDGGCLDQACTEQVAAADECLLDCAARVMAEGGDADRCMRANCPQAQAELDACASPALESGFCDAQMGSCGAGL